MRYYLALLLILLIPSANAYMYKHTDAEGVITYTDIEVEGSEQIIPPEGNNMKAPKHVTSKKTADAPKSDYDAFHIVSPENNSTFRDNNGNIPITLMLTPELDTTKGHTISAYLDGKKTFANGTSLSITINNVDRGTHTIYAVVTDSKAKTLIQTETITIHLKQFSILH